MQTKALTVLRMFRLSILNIFLGQGAPDCAGAN